jgi:hypothetical protein
MRDVPNQTGRFSLGEEIQRVGDQLRRYFGRSGRELGLTGEAVRIDGAHGKAVMNPEMTDLDQAVIALGRASHPPERIAVVSSPVLAALKAAGTEHVYADTADTDELGPVVAGPGDTIVAEVDGNTVNQPLVRRVVDRYVASIGYIKA